MLISTRCGLHSLALAVLFAPGIAGAGVPSEQSTKSEGRVTSVQPADAALSKPVARVDVLLLSDKVALSGTPFNNAQQAAAPELETRYADGTVRMDLNGDFQVTMQAVMGPDGKLMLVCDEAGHADPARHADAAAAPRPNEQ
jgi:hypothetical protein